MTTEQLTVWNEIKGKVRYYKTAYFNGNCVAVLGATPDCDGFVTIAYPPFGEYPVACHELTDYCL